MCDRTPPGCPGLLIGATVSRPGLPRNARMASGGFDTMEGVGEHGK
jgi:hypothetical protein